MGNVYHSPETWGFEVVGELNDPNACYSFNDLVVWRAVDTGQLYWASDSGCSCPSPFEDLRKEDLGVVSDDTWTEFEQAVQGHCRPWDPTDVDGFAADKTQLLAKVALLLAAS